MSVALRFLELASAWADHCQAVSFSSNAADYDNHPAARELAALGPAVVPLIMARYETDFSCPWEYPLTAVTGASMTDDPSDFDPSEVHRRRLAWWADNRHRYAPAA